MINYQDLQNKDQWQRVCDYLKNDLGEATFKSWISHITLEGTQGSVVRLGTKNRFTRDWVATHYKEMMIRAWYRENSNIKDIELVVQTPKTTQDSNLNLIGTEDDEASTIKAVENPNNKDDLDPRFTFDSFVVGKSNELAFAAAKRVAESEQVSFNPLFLYGGVGLGKTHLMHAIAWHIRQHAPERKVAYLSAEKFMYKFISALRQKNIMAFKEEFRSIDVLMIDDVQFIGGRDATQEEFFHTFNALVDQNRQIIISADKSPSDLDGLEERLKSRLGWGLVADIHPTNFELRLGILQTKASLSSAHIPLSVLEFMAHKITSNVRELEGALNRLIAHATLMGKSITIESAQDLLKDLLKNHDKVLTIEDIQKKIVTHYNIKMADLHSARRTRAVARPRQVAMYLCKALTTASLPEIGRNFGGRDHTTVMHAIKTVQELRQSDPGLNQEIDLLYSVLKN